jgi:hypothetical protein
LSPEEIAAEYKYLMSQEYRIAELEKKSPKDAIATIRIEKREAEKLEGLSAEELMRLYKEEIANNGR